jgi:LmbE family N-acetylglucosaminyl deacetylase
MLTDNPNSGNGGETRLIVIEPHADDAYLSLHEHLLRWKRGGFRITILTVQSAVENRAEEAEAYARAIGVDWMGLGYDYGQLPTTIDLAEPASTLIVAPFGLQHPDHIAIRAILRPALCYLDIPYYTKQKNQTELNQKLTDHELHSIYTPAHGKQNKKYWGCFRSQAKFFYYNPPREIARIPEITVSVNGNVLP